MKINKRLWVATAALGIASAAVVAVKGQAHGDVPQPVVAAPCPGAVSQQVTAGPATQVDLTVVEGAGAERSKDIQIHVASCSPSNVNARVESGAPGHGTEHLPSAPEQRAETRPQHSSVQHEATRLGSSLQPAARVAG